jgi:hypothetical protein
LEDTSNLAIEQVTCGPGHEINVGNLYKYISLNGVTNVTVKKEFPLPALTMELESKQGKEGRVSPRD